MSEMEARRRKYKRRWRIWHEPTRAGRSDVPDSFAKLWLLKGSRGGKTLDCPWRALSALTA